jgi:hypothetical protein
MFACKERGELLRDWHDAVIILAESIGQISRDRKSVPSSCSKNRTSFMSIRRQPRVLIDTESARFWFTVSPLLTDPLPMAISKARPLPRYLEQPDVILDSIWALPDLSLHALGDYENS